MMHHVTGDDGRLAPGLDHDTDMARRMARRRHQSQLGRYPVVEVDRLRQTGIEDRLDRIRHDLLGLAVVVLRTPELVFILADEIFRVWKSRSPFAVLEHR